MNFKSYLEEGRNAPLYHATTFESIKRILHTQKLEAGHFGHFVPGYNGKRLKGVSLTRNFKMAKWWVRNGIILELDQRLLSQRYKIVPMNYDEADGIGGISAARYKERTGTKGTITHNEYEEYVLTTAIKEIDKYIIKIHMNEEAFYDYERQEDKSYNVLFQHPKLFVNRKFINK